MNAPVPEVIVVQSDFVLLKSFWFALESEVHRKDSSFWVGDERGTDLQDRLHHVPSATLERWIACQSHVFSWKNQ